MTVVTTKTSVEEILEDNNIVVEDDERVTPSLESEITENNKIVITNKSEQEVQIAKISESGLETTLDEILKSYSPIIEKIVVEQEKIPYETITKDASQGLQI
ncbi:MAG: ubiquitin-like domain-containing protein [Clostridia bacterium]